MGDRAHVQDQCGAPEKLVFLHIPKNAGSAIEHAGIAHGVRWGMFMNFSGCDMGSSQCRPLYHTPPAEMRSHSMYSDARVFCTIRNPYARAVSVYKFMVKLPFYRFEFADI